MSNDNLTTLVGQNESGKTAILSALAVTFSGGVIDSDDIRHGQPYPLISTKTQFSENEWLIASSKVKASKARESFVKCMREADGIIVWNFDSEVDPSDATSMTTSYTIVEPDFDAIVVKIVAESATLNAIPVQAQESSPSDQLNDALLTTKKFITHENLVKETSESSTEFTDALFKAAPTMTLFKESSGSLPNKIDVEDDYSLAVTVGAAAARNFLKVAQIDLKTLVLSDSRARAVILKAANNRVTRGFLSFWSQTVGNSSPLQIECAIHQHSAGHAKVGKSCLEFLITDNSGPLYPGQRSQGTRWFISFYLQMSASGVGGGSKYYLIDEPGSNLHEKAQKDVLIFLEKIKENVGIVYSTHIPHLLDENALHRVLAVERDAADPLHPTRVIGSHALGAANADTLSPILTVMGANFSRQTTIKKNNNVILEELSSQYYLRAFWKLVGSVQEVNFLPATGVSNVSIFANLLLGWGLDYVVVVDDEASGRSMFNQLKRDHFLDDQAWAERRMYKVKDCEGIEDIFSTGDYSNFVLNNPGKKIEKSNSRWAKANGAAKAMHAMRFLHMVEKGEVALENLEEGSITRIRTLVSAIENRLQDYAATPPNAA